LRDRRAAARARSAHVRRYRTVIHALTFAAYAVTLDGKTVLPHARAAVADGRVLLPVRTLGNALGADVGYDGRAHTITVQRGAHVATIPARGAVRIVNGTAYAPLRAVATAFGLGVGYEARTRTVALGDPRAAASSGDSRAAASSGSGARGAQQPVDAAAPAPRSGTFVVTETPRNAAQVHEPYPAISARFAGAAAIDPRSLHVVVDGRDVTGDASIVGDQVLYTPRTALAPGTHYVVVTGRDASTGAALGNSWSFEDSFDFTSAPAPTPFPVGAIWVDRWIVPGTNAFDVYVEGAPGMTGYVGVDGVGGFFPLRVNSANSYVAHVVVPNGVNQPFARVAARITLPNGQQQFIVLPQRFNLVTPPIVLPATPPPARVAQPTPTPQSIPIRRSVNVPTPTPAGATSAPTPPRRRILDATPAPSPTRTPTPPPPRTPTPPPARTPSPPGSRTAVPAAAATPGATPTPIASPERTRRPLIKRTLPPKPTPEPAAQ
ncbi:MAG: hypothetical protein JWM87_1841, partial [Candidatus Eremiobacteraeota bacterium]|nr:hypothetical protein [Candidatus Eremiobacteraeota bacterium]